MVYRGIAVHKRLNESVVYQKEIPPEKIVLGLPITTVNRSGILPPGFIAVEPPEVYEIDELDMAA